MVLLLESVVELVGVGGGLDGLIVLCLHSAVFAQDVELCLLLLVAWLLVGLHEAIVRMIYIVIAILIMLSF